ncbi:MAG: metalloregulator ArsR/SmtB family transcription factor [Patescibacteria group bacterium]|nr:metalloregulator ArsR/SmtB family transcription factor [Patescibacteria group bacterium]
MKTDKKQTEKTSLFLHAIAEKNRFEILRFLKNDEKCVCEIWKHLKIPQNLASHHLKILKNLGLITAKKQGLWIICKLNKKNLKQNIKFLDNLFS